MTGSLDHGNHLHLHPDDSNCASIVSVKLTRVENYRIWASTMKLAVQIKHKMSFVIGTYVRSSYLASASLIEQCDIFNVVVLNWILSSLSQDVYLGNVFSDNAQIVWKELEETYDRIDGSIVFNLLSELGDHGKLMKLMQFLIGLDDIYQPIRSSLLTREVLLEVKDAFMILAKEESHRGIPATTANFNKPQAYVFAFRVNDVKRSNSNANWHNGNTSNNNKGNYNNLLCKNCGLKGHTIETCFKIIGQPPDFKRNPNLKVNGTFNNNKSNNADLKGNYAGTNNFKTSTGTLSFTNELNNNVILFVALVIPEYCVSLLSMHKLIKDSKLSVCFNETRCLIQDLKNKKIQGTGSESAGLYLFDVDYDKVAEPNLSQLRSFGCLCFAAIVKGSDKFSERSEKCVLIGYASGKKAYKLVSLENRNVLYSRDVKFYETFFLFKMNNNDKSLNEHTDISTLNFFDQYELDFIKKTPINDYEEDSPSRDRTVHQPVNGSETEQPRHDGDNSATHDRIHQPVSESVTEQPGHDGGSFASPLDEIDIFEGNVGLNKVYVFQSSLPSNTKEGGPGRSQRASKLPAKLNEFVLDTKVKYGLNKPVMTPLPENLVLSHKESDSDKFVSNITGFQKLMGKLIYLTYTRHDISYYVHCLSQHMHAPLRPHFDIALRALKYLKLAPRLGVNFSKRKGDCLVTDFFDSDWAKCHVTRKSVSGYCVLINDSLVSWKSKRQATLSKSYVEVEYRCMASTTCEVM
uniref:Ribonuclease H-like domain-containing protein n=1 Tax=Tanacetum cinerariifolium TaxID=118510 RepID=A0A699HFI9_TANCI|nr:ribonuclease H-like domain-containing protein [Tanacetum cinerariifolium]